jgi:hypothetical protein
MCLSKQYARQFSGFSGEKGAAQGLLLSKFPKACAKARSRGPTVGNNWSA